MIMGRVTVSLWLIVKTFQKVPILTNASGTANMAKVVPEEKLGAMEADDRQWSCGNAETGLLSRVCDSLSLVVQTGPQTTTDSMW